MAMTPDQWMQLQAAANNIDLSKLAPGTSSYDLGNGNTALINWQYSGGENGTYTNPVLSGIATPNNGTDGSATNYGIYDPSTGALKQNYQTGAIDKYAFAPFLAAGAGALLAGGLGAAGSAMTVPTEAAANAAGDAFASGLSPYAAGATAGLGGAAGGAAGAGGALVDSGLSPMTLGNLRTLGMGSVAGAAGGMSGLLQYAAPILGALAGAHGVKQTQTATRDIPSWLHPYVTGPNGLLSNAQNLFQQQMGNQQGWQNMGNVTQGLLNAPVAGNGFSKMYGGK